MSADKSPIISNLDKLDLDAQRAKLIAESLEAAKMRFESATEELRNAKSEFEHAKSYLEAAASKVDSERAQAQITVSKLEKEKSELGSELQQSKTEVQRLSQKMMEVSNTSTGSRACACARLEEENLNLRIHVEECKSKLEEVTNENKSLHVENKRLGERVPKPMSSGNPTVFMAFKIRDELVGRIVFELFADTTPRAVENFRALCTGEKGVSPTTGKPLHYKGMSIYEVQHRYIFGGSADGESIYGGTTIPVENFIRNHTGRGDLSLNSNSKPHCPGGYFVISTDKNSQWDGIDVVIGRIVAGMDVLDTIVSAFPGTTFPPTGSILISDSGQLS